jgi:hypothetical protein
MATARVSSERRETAPALPISRHLAVTKLGDRSELSAGGGILDVFMEIWAIIVIAQISPGDRQLPPKALPREGQEMLTGRARPFLSSRRRDGRDVCSQCRRSSGLRR